MKNQEEIKSIKLAQRELADRLEALETEEPKREPQAGDVWQCDAGKRLYVTNRQGQGTNLHNGYTTAEDVRQYGASITYLGKAKDVLMLRSDVEKDYVSKEQLRRYVITDSLGYQVGL